ncbi:MAG: lytic transglycosylase domain-containing protein [Alphaproteobacteria bacterium]|nr:lytic transglycosylase domain-containing protein [Alphaproteobacteria bacterium]
MKQLAQILAAMIVGLAWAGPTTGDAHAQDKPATVEKPASKPADVKKAPAKTAPKKAAKPAQAKKAPAKAKAAAPAPAKARILPLPKPPVPERKTTAAPPDDASGPSGPFRVRTEPKTLSPKDRDTLVQALNAAERGRRDNALDLAGRLGNPSLSALVDWVAMRSSGPKIGFLSRIDFLRNHPDWPSEGELIREAEDAAVSSDDSTAIVAWFKEFPPATTSGRFAEAKALLALGRKEEAVSAAQQTWIKGRFEAREERDFLRLFDKDLTADDHRARLQELLYAERRQDADRFLRRVDADSAAIAKVRIALIGGAGNVERMLAQLPERLRSDPGLVYDRIKWRRKRGREDSARELLPKIPDTYPRPDLWWKERDLLARDSLEKKRHQEAYDIVKNQRAEDPASIADAEWLAGWIALRFLKQPEAAMAHFNKVYDVVQIAANSARAAFWMGRAAADNNRPDVAAEWYRRAALHPATFYGQLAIGRLTGDTVPTLPMDPIPTAAERAAFEAKDLAKVVRAISELPGTPYLRPFLLALAASSDFATDRVMAAELADGLGRPDLSVWISRQAARDRIIVLDHGYPIPPFAFPNTPERALVLGVIRQESNFDTTAESGAGAVGLMQLMPATARAVGNQIGLRYSKENLSRDPSYNIRLGTTYLRSLINDFNGSYLMAVAGYNAGPGRSVRWARTFGDPRDPNTDVVDWVEQIPFNETRGYVQRVFENLMVYRARLAGTQTVGTDLEKVLRQGGGG